MKNSDVPSANNLGLENKLSDRSLIYISQKTVDRVKILEGHKTD